MLIYAPLAALILGAALFQFTQPDLTPPDHADELRNDDGSWKYTNRLADSTSPYLLQHAHNPVDWYPWGEEALAAAREHDKPIFLSVGYSTCYWCHVMEREVFENPEIAKMMNELFINIKVDREQRPDLDEVYMTATQLMTQRGGWPMSVFLTPDLKPFYAGTYFGPEDRAGRPGFPTVADAMHKAWTDQRAEVIATADRAADTIRANLTQRTEHAGTRALSDAIPNAAQSLLAGAYDDRWGGFGVAPKFPQGYHYPFLFDIHEKTGEPEARDMAVNSLEHMAAGGLYDHVGGGFHRYSTDGQWKVPHFEKMLYNQAQLTRAYLRAYEVTGDEAFADVARGILAYVEELMTGPDAQFYSALDAETDATEGAYYAWNRDQIQSILTSDEMQRFDEAFAIAPIPAFPGHKHPDGGALIMQKPINELAEDLGIGYETLRKGLDSILAKLKQQRDLRERPRLDDKVIAGWNGLMIGAYAQAGTILEEAAYTNAARNAADFVLTRMRDDDGNLLRLWRKGVSEQPAFQEDYAFLIQGLTTLHRNTDQQKWLDAAEDLARRADQQFWDKENGGYYFTTQSPDLIAMSKSARDGAIPSGNSAMAHALLDLWEHTGDESWRSRAEELLATFSGLTANAPTGHVHMVHAIDRFITPQQPDRPTPEEHSRGETPVTLPDLKGPIVDPASTDSAAHASVSATIEPKELRIGEKFTVRIGIDIAPGWHINADRASSPNLIPTRVDVRSDLPITIESVAYPDPVQLSASYSETPIDVFEGNIEITATCLLRPEAKADPDASLRIATVFQACDDQSCLAPKTQLTSLAVRVTE